MSGSEAVTWRAFFDEAVRRLTEAGFPSPQVDARRIVERAGGFEPAEWYRGLDEHATRRGVAFFDRMLERRLAGEPLQYVLGRWGFRTLDLLVDRRVLIPRPETEVVVEHAVAELDRLAQATERPLVAADLGTGSGAIALSLVAERSRVEVWAVDVSPEALEVAGANLAGLGQRASRVRLAEGDWFGALPGELRGALDLVVSNPPYVGASEELPGEVIDWEPGRALIAGPVGTEALEHLLREAPQWLSRPGAVVLELAPSQAERMRRLAEMLGYDEARVEPDLTGRPRVLVARLRS
ncbi:MAG: peptide chain release factor N(5)-glutamine methyltransferase [Acidimicrobiales bacterium]